MTGDVVIDFLPEAARRYGHGWTIVAIDVIRATTTAVTAAWCGHEVFPARSLDDARAVADGLERPLLVGELAGDTPPGFEETNSPVAVNRRGDVERPVVLLSTNGSTLLREAGERSGSAYAACLRNASAQAEWLVGRHRRIALVGAGSQGDFRIEDQYCCARIAAALLRAGYRPRGATCEVVDRWAGLPVQAIATGRSAAFLRRTGQVQDLDFVLTHVDDVPAVFPILATERCRVSLEVTGGGAADDRADEVVPA